MTNHCTDNQLINYVNHSLTDNQRETIDLHLNTCQDCRTRLAEQEALHRRIHYSIINRHRQVRPSTEMSFGAIALQVKRSRRFTMFRKQSNQVIYGAATLVTFLILAIGLITLFGRTSESPTSPEIQSSIPTKTAPLIPTNTPNSHPTPTAIDPTSTIQDEPAPEATVGYAETSSGKLYYEVMGEGAPVVLLHGLVMHQNVWDEQFETLAQTYKVIRYDRPGYGRSQEILLEQYINIEDLRALLQFLDIPKATLIGSEAGGKIALDFTLAYPDKVEALVLVGATLSGSSQSTDYLKRIQANFRPINEASRSASGIEAKDIEATIENWVTDPSYIAPENAAVRQRVRQYLMAYPPNPQVIRFEKAPDFVANGHLSEIQVPTLLIVGQADIKGIHEYAARIEAGVEGAEKIVIPHAGHLVQMEQPEMFNQVVLDFLSKVTIR